MEPRHRCSLPLGLRYGTVAAGWQGALDIHLHGFVTGSAGAVQEQKDKVVVTIEDYLWFWLHIIQPEESLAPSRFTNFTLKELQVTRLQAPSPSLISTTAFCASLAGTMAYLAQTALPQWRTALLSTHCTSGCPPAVCPVVLDWHAAMPA